MTCDLKPVVKPRTTHVAEKTKTRFLLAAEQVFCADGYTSATIRKIARTADANLGTLQHYWGDKQTLFRDLFRRRFLPMHEEHYRQLQVIQQKVSAGEKPDPEEVLQTLVDLTFSEDFLNDTVCSDPLPFNDNIPLRVLYGHALCDPSPFVIAELNQIFNDSMALFLNMMRQACTHLGENELNWRLRCIAGAHLFSLIEGERMALAFTNEAEFDAKRVADWVLHFLVSGVTAPAFRSSEL